ncbi:hypothetical protein IC762_19570 [Bradyrhizobium genosp. L]|uniref:hypothetical protein n=1 Tax=Bradyrhizobium genosp. L TaxID=83637 RepID=UPI0018A264EB|nr:hypothetical protein [Bradyrhizobium genosp. L]QPF81995.1 hypothetical protein IC762_19570 [Bradyrhizobium genosp. L]
MMLATLREWVVQRPRAMRRAPRDGTRIEALTSGNEWLEVYWDPFEGAWHAGHHFDHRKIEDLNAWRPLRPLG